MKLIDPETNKEYEFVQTPGVSALMPEKGVPYGTLKPVEGSVQNVPNPKGGVQNEPVLDKELEKILQNEFGSGTENGVYVDDFVGTVAQIKSTIKEALLSEVPEERVASLVVNCPYCKRNFPMNEEEYNQALQECKEVIERIMK